MEKLSLGVPVTTFVDVGCETLSGKASAAFPPRVAGCRSMSASKILASATPFLRRISTPARLSVCARSHVAIEGSPDVGV